MFRHIALLNLNYSTGILSGILKLMKPIILFIKNHFGARELIALCGSIVILLAVVIISPKLGDLEGLGYLGGFLAMLLGSATIILPAPGLAVVAALSTVVASPFLLGVMSGIGATLGELTGYLAGYGSHKLAEDEKGYPRLAKFVEKYGFWAIALLALIPNPLFDLAGLIAGGTKYPIKLFILATLIGKVLKCIIVAYTGAWSLGLIN